MVRPLLLLLLAAWVATPATAGAPFEALAPGGEAVVAEIVDGDTVVLSDGRQVRLVGIQAPKLPLGRPDFAPWPLADRAKAALADIALGRTVGLGFGGRRMDRHGRWLAHLFAPGGLWVQGELLTQGLARVYSFADNRALAAEMLALEGAARDAGRGIWADPFYRVRVPEEADAETDSFQLVEGRIVSAAVVRGRGYLNFGPDWRNDFTLAIDPQSRRLFEAEGRAVESYEGLRVRARGWLKSFNGPMIEITHPEQIEVLSE